jgi:sugar phosphate isomerase/epimerase
MKTTSPSMNRRRFIRHATVSAVMVSLLPGIARGAETPWKLRQSCSSINFTRLPIEEACQRIAALGFEAIDLWSAHAGCPHLDDAQKRLGAEGLKALLEKHKLQLCAFSVYAGGYPRYAELLGKMGGGVAVRGSSAPCTPEELTAKMKVFLEALKPELELCEKHNSYLAIENHGSALLDSLDSFKAFTDLNQHPRLGLALAPYHLQIPSASVEQAIEISGRQLLFFYAWQHADGLKQLPGHGPTDFTPMLRALAKIRYPRFVNPFLHGEPEPDAMVPALAKARDYLADCGKKL